MNILSFGISRSNILHSSIVYQSLQMSAFLKTSNVVAVDLGNDKIIISKIESNNESPIVVPDMMDMRNIPNRVMFLKDKDQIRKFGNNTVLNKSWDKNKKSISQLPPLQPSLLQTSDILVGDQIIERVPGFIIKNMIMGYVKQIIHSKYPGIESSDKQHYVVVPSWDESSTNILFDTLGAKTILMNENKEINVETLSDLDAMIFNYISRYMLKKNKDSKYKNKDEENVPKKNILIIDIGHKKTNFVLFSVSKDKGVIIVQQLMTITEKEISGSKIDDLLVEYMRRLAKDKYKYDPDQSLDSSSKFRAQCIRLKHQLSLNKKINFTFETPERDLVFEISRSDFEHDLKVISMLLEKNIEIINETWGNPNVIELIGGSGRLPMFKDLIDTMYPSIQRTMNPDETVSNGAAYYGQLLTTKNNNILYSKIAQKNVDVQYVKNHETQIIRVFEKYQIINPMSSDSSVIRITKSQFFQIIIQDLKIHCETDISYCDDEFMDVELMYNMTDLVDVISIKDTKTGKNIPFQLYVHTTDSKYQMNIEELIKKYAGSEMLIKGMEFQNEIHGSVVNYIEEYYYDTEGINKIIQNINRQHGLQQNIVNIESDRKEKDLKYPLKELCEFYDFCRFYTKVPETKIEQQSYDYIVDILNNPDGLNGIIGAIDKIKDIKSKYGN